jgi:acetylornithine deacetylase/succinyl-diaminopimelate desuccinylase-like protein
VEITVYGARQDLHSGNYGNWAPNPALALARLLASMKDETGRVRIRGFYADVVPLTAAERQALTEIPDLSEDMRRRFGFARPDNDGRPLDELHNEPTLNINGLQSGTVGGQGRTIIPATATASLDLRFVKNVTPDEQFANLLTHIRDQGFEVVSAEPTDTQRARYAHLAKVTRRGGYPSGRTPLELPIAEAITRAVANAGVGRPVRLPTLGGSAPFYIFTDLLKIPAIGLPIANFDNNQHGPNENLRLANLWEGIDQIAAVLLMPGEHGKKR